MTTNFLDKLTEEQINTFLNGCVSRLSSTGISFDFVQNQNQYPLDNKYNLKLNGEYFGALEICRWNDEDRLVAEISFYTKIEMITKSTFTKTAMRHNCNIKWNNFRSYELRTDKDWQKCIDWIVLLNKQYKTTLTKKKKFEMETDFE